jgi:hypothetical protein
VSNRFVRTASAAAVGAVLVGVLPGVASAAAAPTVAVTPPAAFDSGATTSTPFKMDLTGADAATNVSVRFTLGGPSALDKNDVVLEALDPATKRWAPITITDVDSGLVSGTYAASGIELAAGAKKAVDLRVQILDKIVDGPLNLGTELVTADGSVLASDHDELDVTGVSDPKLAITDATAVESGQYLPFSTTSSNPGREYYGTAMKIEIDAEKVPAGTELFLQYNHWGDYWGDIPLRGTGGVYTTVQRELFRRDLHTGNTRTDNWRVVSSDPSVLGKVNVTAALVDIDSPSTVLATAATTTGSFTASTVDMTVAVADLGTVLKKGAPVQGTVTFTNENPEAGFTGQGRVELEGVHLKPWDVAGRFVDGADNTRYVNFSEQNGKVVGTFDVGTVAAASSLTGTLTLELHDEGRDGLATVSVSAVREKTSYNTWSGPLELDATTTAAQPTGVQFYGSASKQAVVSWKAPTDPNTHVYVDVVGDASDSVWVRDRNEVSRTVLGMPAGVPVTVSVRTEKYDEAQGWVRSIPVFATYTAPAPELPAPSDLSVVPDDSYGHLDEFLSWNGSADVYRVVVTDKKTGERFRETTSIPFVGLNDEMMYTTPGRTYTISVAAYDYTADKWGDAATLTYTSKAPVDPGAKLVSVRGETVVSWTSAPQSLYTVTVNGKTIPFKGSSVAVDRYLVPGTNTVYVAAENHHGTESTELTVTTSKVQAALSASKVVYGDVVKYTGSVTAAIVGGRSVQVQQYDAAKKVWNGIGSAVKTDAKGKFAIPAKPSRTGSYRVVVLAAGESAGAAGASTGISVAPDTTLTASASSVRAGEIVTLVAKPAGAVTNTKVTFQQLVGGKWKSVDTDSVSKGAASTKVRLSTRGTVSFRAVVAGTSVTTAAVSGTVKVAVK